MGKSDESQRGSGRLGPAVWAAIKIGYVAGNETHAQIAQRYGITVSAVEKRASPQHSDNDGIGWDEARRNYLARIAAESEALSVQTGSATLAQVKNSSVEVALLSLERIQARLRSGDEFDTKDLVAIARLSTGLRIELAGDANGTPININQTIDHGRILDRLPVDVLRVLAGDIDESDAPLEVAAMARLISDVLCEPTAAGGFVRQSRVNDSTKKAISNHA